MTDDLEWFEPKGRISVKAAAMQVIRRIEPKSGVTYSQALTDIRELTGNPALSKSDIMGAMTAASKELRSVNGEPGVTNRRGVGWEREDYDGMVATGEKHEKKARRQIRWSTGAVISINVDLLGWDARARRDGLLSRNQRAGELEARRAQRRRPIDRPEDSAG